MRKPRDFDSELKALADKAKQLKERRVRDLGALVTATGADALDADLLAGALLDAATNTDKATGEGWRGCCFGAKGRERLRRSNQADRQRRAAPISANWSRLLTSALRPNIGHS